MFITDKEIEALYKWHQQHKKFAERNEHAIELQQLTGGGIGTRLHATCLCGEKHDITDYESW